MLDVRGRKNEQDFKGPPPVGEVSAQPEVTEPKQEFWKAGSGLEANKTNNIHGVGATGSNWSVLIFWGLMAIITGIAGIFATFQTSRVNAKGASYMSQIQDAQSKLTSGDLAQTLEQMKTIEGQVLTFKDYVDNSLLWPKILLEFSQKVPTNIKITELYFSEDNAFYLKGEAKKYVDVANFVVALKSSPIFKDIAINSSSATLETEGPKSVNFDIKLNINPVNSKNVNDLFKKSNTK